MRDVLDPAFIAPDAVAELSAALWLALKGAHLPTVAKEVSSIVVS
jgi:hypothetical protein